MHRPSRASEQSLHSMKRPRRKRSINKGGRKWEGGGGEGRGGRGRGKEGGREGGGVNERVKIYIQLALTERIDPNILY